MSPIALGMDLVLAVLLLAALGFGIRLERRLKALREGQATFVGAVADLDRAAQRAERGLAELRAATDEALDLLAGRIEKARDLAARLETHTAEAARPAPRPAEPPRPQAVSRFAPDMAPIHAEAAAEELLLRLTERPPPERSMTEKPLAEAPRAVRLEPRPAPRPRAVIDDDDLFDAPMAAAGGRR